MSNLFKIKPLHNKNIQLFLINKPQNKNIKFFKKPASRLLVPLNKNFLHFSPYDKNKSNLNIYSNYRFYKINPQTTTLKYFNTKYYKNLNNFKKLNQIIKYKYFNHLPHTLTPAYFKLTIIWSYLYLYNNFLLSVYHDFYFYLKNFKNKNISYNYRLILNFIKNKFFINLQTLQFKKNYFFLSTGLFIKFFEKKKSFKKSKTIKLLMAKFIRKLFLVSKIKTVILIIKKIPLFLIEFLTLLNTPIIHKFIDPINKKIIEEKDENKVILNFVYFIFLQNIDFSLNKGPQKGRIKRKILRKLIINNKIID